MNKVAYMAHEWSHRNKSQLGKYTGGIKNTILNYPRQGTAQELASLLTTGHTVILGELKYAKEDLQHLEESPGAKIAAQGRHWRSQQVFALDFDNDEIRGKKTVPLSPQDPRYLTYEKAIKIAEEANIPPAFVYTTFSHKPHQERFRMVFVIDETITDKHDRQSFLSSLFEVFALDGIPRIDSKCSDLSRLFYPGIALVHENYAAMVKKKDVLRVKPTSALPVPTGAINRLRGLESAPSAHRESSKFLKALKDKSMITEVQKVLSDLLRQAPNPWCDLVKDVSSRVGTVTIILYRVLVSSKVEVIKAYCTQVRENSKSTATTRGFADDFDSDSTFDPFGKTFINTPEAYYQAVSSFPWHIAFEKRLGDHFNCILPGHTDNNASAVFELTPNGEYVYHCYGCQGVDRYHDIFNLLEVVMEWSAKETKEFLNELLGFEFETAWQKEIKEEITSFQDFLRTKTFRANYPFLYKELIASRSFGVYNTMLSEARRMILDKIVTKTDDPIFFTGVRRVSQLMKEDGVTVGVESNSIQKKLKYLQRLGFFVVLDDRALPTEVLAVSNKMRSEKGYRYRVNMFGLPPLTMNLLADAEEKAKWMKEHKVKRQHVSIQSEIWMNDGVNKVFAQDKHQKESAETKKFYKHYSSAADELLARGYTTQKELLHHKKVRRLKNKKDLAAIVMPRLFDEKSLKTVRYSKHYQELLSINDKDFKLGRTNIIVSKNI